jgi:putative salt-induced outer membrane protein
MRFMVLCFLAVQSLAIVAQANQAAATSAPAAATPAPVVEKSPWTNESQLAVVQTSGNSETESYSAKQTTSYTRGQDLVKATGSYLKTAAENATTGANEETALKYDAGVRYERAFTDHWSSFVGYLLESDRYAGYMQKHNTDLGGKYIIAKTEKYDLLSEAGYRYVHQNNVDQSNTHYNSARLYLEGVYRLNATNSAKLWVEHLPNFDVSEDHQTNAEASLSSAINTVFSLKVAYLMKTDNLPVPGAEKTDTTLTTALVAKF